jgi:hypothetical protein
MACEALCEEEIVRGAVYGGHRAVTSRVKGIQAGEASSHLPRSEDDLNSTLRDASASLIAEQWCGRVKAL